MFTRSLLPIYLLLATSIYAYAQTSVDLKLDEQTYVPLNWDSEKEIGLGIAALAGLTLYASSSNDQGQITDPNSIDLLDPNDVNRFDRGATDNWSLDLQKGSDYLEYGSLAIPLLLVFNANYKADMVKHMVYAAETVAITVGVTHTLKNLIHRARPLAYNTDLPYSRRLRKRNNQSFPSGHTSFTTCLTIFGAKTWTDLNPDLSQGQKVAIWSGATLIPAVMGYLRVKGGKHFTTDVIAGGLIGAVTGWAIPHLHLTGDKQSFSLAAGPGGVVMSYTF